MEEELLEVVDEAGRVLRVVRRSEAHGNPALLHRVAHVLVFGSEGRLLLQKRSLNKDVAAGKWDTSVGGHVDPGEEPGEAARREMREELSIECEPRFLYSYIHSNPYESELVYTFTCVHDGGFVYNRDEIDEVRFWSMEEIMAALGGDALSDNFKHEITTYLEKAGAVAEDPRISNPRPQL